MLTTILLFIFILGLLVFVHEGGHFIAAKRAGAKVEEFGFGFPPRIFGIKKGETIYSLNLIPVGGFVKILGEDGSKRNNPRSFAAKSLGKRTLMLISGILMNFLLAGVLLSVGHALGLPTIIEGGAENAGNARDLKVQIIGIAPGSPAEKADLRIGDALREVKSEKEKLKIFTVEEVQRFVDENKGKEIVLIAERAKETLEKTVVPRVEPVEGEGALGIVMVKTGIVSFPWYEAIFRGFESAIMLFVAILVGFFRVLKDFISTGSFGGEIAGPVGIAVLAGQAKELGFVYLLQFTAFLSINLAIINGIPFPALDGGRLLFLLLEKIKGRPVSRKSEQLAHTIGFALLIVLMAAITFRDIVRFFK